MNKSIGNQQLSSHSDLGWLGGIIDGEGCIQLAKQRYGKNLIHYRPQIAISNTNTDILNNVIRIAKENNLPVYIFERHKLGRGKRRQYVIQISGIKRCRRWLELLRPYIVGKNKQLVIALEYINYRESNPENKVSDIDHDFKERISQINQLHKGELLNDYTLNRDNNSLKV